MLKLIDCDGARNKDDRVSFPKSGITAQQPSPSTLLTAKLTSPLSPHLIPQQSVWFSLLENYIICRHTTGSIAYGNLTVQSHSLLIFFYKVDYFYHDIRGIKLVDTGTGGEGEKEKNGNSF